MEHLKNYIIRKLGGFPDVPSCIDHIMKTGDLKAENQLLSASVKHLLNTISADEIFQQRGVTWYFENKPLSLDQVTGLKNEARFFEKTFLCKVLDTKIKYISNKKIHEATNLSELLVAKSILYTWDIVKDALKKELA